MLVTKKSALSGIVRTRDLPISEEQLEKWKLGQGLIQDIFSNLSAPDREFIMTGITEEEWDEAFEEPEDEQ